MCVEWYAYNNLIKNQVVNLQIDLVQSNYFIMTAIDSLILHVHQTLNSIITLNWNNSICTETILGNFFERFDGYYNCFLYYMDYFYIIDIDKYFYDIMKTLQNANLNVTSCLQNVTDSSSQKLQEKALNCLNEVSIYRKGNLNLII